MNPSNYPGAAMQSSLWAGEITPPAQPYMDPPGTRQPAAPSTVADPHLNMHHGQSGGVIQLPQDRDEVYLGSLKAMLGRNVGNHIIATFLLGSQNLVSWEGILYDVGNNYLTIYQEPKGRYVVADLYSLKFMEFYEPEENQTLSSIPKPAVW